ncbi:MULTISPECIES: SRPBCC domain-containing protein [unclassified Streptomyces]|uniref:SRPBCC domain-containing protein n=1 Tax=unclassified Streptomyces TaxID=2593676 RepID=UPI0021C816DD|nr:SRPBCC domain-containing protein [Streptomyces sp. FIT100]UUN28492.1 SRPBCC domain-containing protein [Streptomyces sp. FIT100]
MTDVIPYGTSETRDGSDHLLHFVMHLPHPVVHVWAAVATPEGLPQWLAAADLLEPHLGGGVTLRWLNAAGEGTGTVVSGQVTAWDMECVAEYTVELHGRIRFHMEPAPANSLATVVRFTNEFTGTDEQRLDNLAGWHQHFEYLDAALDGHPADWSAWTPDRFQQLRADYVERDERQVSRP